MLAGSTTHCLCTSACNQFQHTLCPCQPQQGTFRMLLLFCAMALLTLAWLCYMHSPMMGPPQLADKPLSLLHCSLGGACPFIPRFFFMHPTCMVAMSCCCTCSSAVKFFPEGFCVYRYNTKTYSSHSMEESRGSLQQTHSI